MDLLDLEKSTWPFDKPIYKSNRINGKFDFDVWNALGCASALSAIFYGFSDSKDEHKILAEDTESKNSVPGPQSGNRAEFNKHPPDNNDQQELFKPPDRPDLPTYSLDEIKLHGKNADRIWTVFKQVRDRFIYANINFLYI